MANELTSVRIERGTAYENIVPFVECDPPVETKLTDEHISTLTEMGFKIINLEEDLVEDQSEVVTDEVIDEPVTDEVIDEPVTDEETIDEPVDEPVAEVVTESEADVEVVITEEDLAEVDKIGTWKELEEFVTEKLHTTTQELGISKDDGYILKNAKLFLEEYLT